MCEPRFSRKVSIWVWKILDFVNEAGQAVLDTSQQEVCYLFKVLPTSGVKGN